MDSFVAIDFETARAARHTPCAVGLVKVVKGVIVQRFYSIIRPPDNLYDIHNVAVHGINSEHSDAAPEFPQVYKHLKEFINGAHVVCHNAAFDLEVLYQSMEFHQISQDDLIFDYSDTLTLYDRKPLHECCAICGIELNHHDALSDAEACARIFLKYHNTECKEVKPGKGNAAGQFYNHGKIESNHLKPELNSVENTNNIFFKKKVVITGLYNKWPNRNDLAKIIKSMGADIDTGVTERTHILIAGEGAGPKKIEKMLSNIKTDCQRMIMREEEVVKYLDQHETEIKNTDCLYSNL